MVPRQEKNKLQEILAACSLQAARPEDYRKWLNAGRMGYKANRESVKVR